MKLKKKQKQNLIRICIVSAGVIAGFVLPLQGIPRLVYYIAAYLIIGWDILRKAGLGIWHLRPCDENFLMAVATLGAFGLAIWTESGDYTEGVAVMLFYQIGELFQSIAVGKSRRSISALTDLRPDYALIEQDGQLVKTDPAQVAVGTVITVQPGEKVPLDGVIIDGASAVNTATLTGESMPRDVAEGDTLAGGYVNLTGALKLKTLKTYGDSAVARILNLVENAGSRKAKSEIKIARFARIYTPAVCIAALLTAVGVPAMRLFLGRTADWQDWVYRGLTFLVVSCPCALVVSIPLTYFAGIGGAGRAGILVKGASFLEALAKADIAVFDKTGTLTRGQFSVTAVSDGVLPREQMLYYAAHAECASSHPIALGLQAAYQGTVDRSLVTDIREHSGLGITANVNGIPVALGNAKLMRLSGAQAEPYQGSGTAVHLCLKGAYAGCIVLNDTLKEHAHPALQSCKKIGIGKTVLLTGDSKQTGEWVAGELGIDEAYCELLPEDKVAVVERLLAGKKPGKTLLFVGDGINDAPVLTRADVGIAMGALGSDAAVEAADVVLMNDDPLAVAQSVSIARKCSRIVTENIVFALTVKALCLLLTLSGIADMGWAVFADVGVMVLAVLNAIRGLNVQKSPAQAAEENP